MLTSREARLMRLFVEEGLRCEQEGMLKEALCSFHNAYSCRAATISDKKQLDGIITLLAHKVIKGWT